VKTQPIVISDISEVASNVDVIIDGVPLRVKTGQTVTGRYWAIFSAEFPLVGLVLGSDGGSFDAVVGASRTQTATAHAAAVEVISRLRGAA
jgi:hypothetical protein